MNTKTTNPILDVLFAGEKIRIVPREPNHWFVAADVCRVLGLASIDKQIAGLPPELAADTVLLPVSDPTDCRNGSASDPKDIRNGSARKRGENLTRRMTIISQHAVMFLAMRSNKPAAIQFCLWITDILDEIAKYGVYVAGADPAERCTLLRHRWLLERQTQIKAANADLEAQGLQTIALFRELNQVELRDVLSFGRHAAQCAMEAGEGRKRVYTKTGMRRAYSDAVLKAALARLQPQLPWPETEEEKAS